VNVELEKTFTVPNIVVYDDSGPVINIYTIHVEMCVVSTHSADYNTAFDRMKFWFDEIMADSVLLSQDQKCLPAWINTGTRCLALPHTPVDQVVGMMLMSKLTAMVEGRLLINAIKISSPMDDDVVYVCRNDQDLKWFEQLGWWNDARPIWSDSDHKKQRSSKVISLNRLSEWRDHDLQWPSMDSDTDTKAVITTFDKNENK
jgi:hypothetical protein